MSIKLSDSIRVGQQKPLEDKYFNELVPYTSTTQVNTLLPKAVRHIGLTVNINKEEYWYKDGIEDANLVLKVSNTDALILKNQEQDGRLENLEGGLATKLDKGAYTGNAQDLKNEIDTKQKKLSSFDESILVETDGNIEGNVSLFTEYFNTQNCILAFTPIQILGIYKNGLKLLQSEYTITLPKTISINTYTDENIEIQYTHLKS